MGAVFHGGRLDAAIAEFGGSHADWIDLSTGINPNPYPVGEISPAVWQCLPGEASEARLLQAARIYYQVPDEMEIVPANGTQALIELLPKTAETTSVSIISPTYGEHGHVWNKCGHKTVPVSDLETAAKSSSSVAVVINPNNPDCRVHAVSDLIDLAQHVDFLVVDEAFCDCEPEISIVPHMPENVVVLKSFGKFFGLAGMRLGFAICNTERAEGFRSRIGPWAVSGPALEIGARALSDVTWIAGTRESLKRKATDLAQFLAGENLQVEGVNPLFVYAKHHSAMDLYRQLAQAKVLVRPFPENPEYLRFGLPKDADEMERLKQCLKGWRNV